LKGVFRLPGAALAGSVVLFFAVLHGGPPAAPLPLAAGRQADVGQVTTVRFLAFGDVNLARRLGQRLVEGDTLYPFEGVKDTLSTYDVVFANLESNISEQHGRTEDPKSNVVFTAPPAAARALQRAGITVVSTANNHALDFGLRALRETLAFLDSAGVAHAGTAVDAAALYRPAIVTVRGFRCAFFAVTDIMNGGGDEWKRWVAAADTAQIFPAVRKIRGNVDLVVLSFHGGDEYADVASERTRWFARAALDNGVDIFLGHHPHVPYGIEVRGRGIAVHSLGNFVFKQPGRFWTEHGYALSCTLTRAGGAANVGEIRILPLRAGFQPVFVTERDEFQKVYDRVRTLSQQQAWERLKW
jgi:poly-gamma-glutamate synthesis protein (capsule biosynthesis protein)